VAARLELVDAGDPKVPTIWKDLERVARPPYFLSWGWVETWLAALPDGVSPRLAVVHEAGAPVAACFLGGRRLFRHRVVPSRALFVNATGDPALDDITLEHNALLAAPGKAWPLGALVELLPRDWDELYIPAADRDAFCEGALPHGYRLRVDREEPARFIDLDQVRASGDYLKLVSANTRSQIRRAQRRLGAIELEVAGTTARALAIYDELVALHGASWRARGDAGAFADPWIDGFHRRLIAHRFAHGEVHLIRLRTRDATVGCLYNFVAHGRVLFYQSGLAQFDDASVKPGLVCHAAAIAHAAEAGHAVYDLLAGASRYKASLATGTAPLVWLRGQRVRKRFAIEERVRRWKHALDALRARRT
jgi:CelD/BcsL family acetyltransferase involved in cellulose biosynthesis